MVSRGWKRILEPRYTISTTQYAKHRNNKIFANDTLFGAKMVQKLFQGGGNPSKSITFPLLHKLGIPLQTYPIYFP